MNENIKADEEKNKTIKIEENKTNSSIPKTYLFISKKLNNPEKDSQHTKKKYIKFISIKKPYFKVENNSESNKKKSLHNPNINDGRWAEEERNKFIQGIVLYGINWKKVKSLIPTRTAVQVRSHAQKFFHKMKSCKDESLGIDFTLKSVNNIKDMINQIKSKNPNYNITYILKKLSNGCVNKKFLKKKKKLDNNNNISKNDDKNKIIKLDENNNYINNNLPLNQNNNNFNLFENILENNKFNKAINNNINNNFEHNNNQFKPINIIENNINKNNSNTLQNLLNNSLNLNSYNDLLPNKNLNEFKNNLLKDYFSKSLINYPYINLCLINDLLLSRIQLLNSINSIDNIYLYNMLKNSNISPNNSLINLNQPLINNIYPLITNNNFLINNNSPLISNNNNPIININNHLITKKII